jgi:hypothetical protein
MGGMIVLSSLLPRAVIFRRLLQQLREVTIIVLVETARAHWNLPHTSARAAVAGTYQTDSRVC